MPKMCWEEINIIIHSVRGYLTAICKSELTIRKIKLRKLDGETVKDLEMIHENLLNAKSQFRRELEEIEDIISRQPELEEDGFKK